MYQCINMQSMEQFHQNPDTVKELYELFCAELPAYRSQIQQLTAAEESQQLFQVLHKLHGACCYCHAPALKELTASLEQKVQQNIIHSEQINTLIDTIDAVHAELKHYLGK